MEPQEMRSATPDHHQRGESSDDTAAQATPATEGISIQRTTHTDQEQYTRLHYRVYIRQGEWSGLRGEFLGICLQGEQSEKQAKEVQPQEESAGVRLSRNGMTVNVPFKHLWFKYSWDWYVFIRLANIQS
jgi:hypothetical protein